MRKTMKDYRNRGIKNLNKIRGGDDGGTIDKDKIKRIGKRK